MKDSRDSGIQSACLSQGSSKEGGVALWVGAGASVAKAPLARQLPARGSDPSASQAIFAYAYASGVSQAFPTGRVARAPACFRGERRGVGGCLGFNRGGR